MRLNKDGSENLMEVEPLVAMRLLKSPILILGMTVETEKAMQRNDLRGQP